MLRYTKIKTARLQDFFTIRYQMVSIPLRIVFRMLEFIIMMIGLNY